MNIENFTENKLECVDLNNLAFHNKDQKIIKEDIKKCPVNLKYYIQKYKQYCHNISYSGEYKGAYAYKYAKLSDINKCLREASKLIEDLNENIFVFVSTEHAKVDFHEAKPFLSVKITVKIIAIHKLCQESESEAVTLELHNCISKKSLTNTQEIMTLLTYAEKKAKGILLHLDDGTSEIDIAESGSVFMDKMSENIDDIEVS